MQNDILIFKSSFRSDMREIQEFFEAMVGVKIVTDLYLEKVIRAIEVLQNPLIKGEKVRFAATEFQKIPILRGRFIIFFRMKNATTKEIFHIKPAQTNYRFTIHQ